MHGEQVISPISICTCAEEEEPYVKAMSLSGWRRFLYGSDSLHKVNLLMLSLSFLLPTLLACCPWGHNTGSPSCHMISCHVLTEGSRSGMAESHWINAVQMIAQCYQFHATFSCQFLMVFLSSGSKEGASLSKYAYDMELAQPEHAGYACTTQYYP